MTRTDRRRISTLACTAVLILFLVTACGSGRERSASVKSGVATGTAEKGAAATALTHGFATLSVPLPPRRRPLVVGGGNYVFVYGGYVVKDGESGSSVIAQGDGATYDLAKDDWTRVPPAPFPASLYRPTGIWTGDEFVVAGTPCGETTADSESAVCKPGGLSAAAYQPTTKTWRSIQGPSPAPEASLLDVSVVGWAGGYAMFTTNALSADQRVLLLDPAAAKWTSAPVLEGIDAECAVGSEFLAVRTGSVGPSGVSGTASASDDSHPLETLRLEVTPGAARWVNFNGTKKPGPTGSLLERVYCGDGQMIYIPVYPPPVGLDRGALWYQTDGSTWDPLPSFQSAGFNGTPSPAKVGTTRMVFMDNGDELFVLPAGSGEWQRVKSPMPGLIGLKPIDNDLLLMDGTFAQDPSEPLRLGLLQPDVYLAAPEKPTAPTSPPTVPPQAHVAPATS